MLLVQRPFGFPMADEKDPGSHVAIAKRYIMRIVDLEMSTLCLYPFVIRMMVPSYGSVGKAGIKELPTHKSCLIG